MRAFALIVLLAGLGLFGWLLYQADLSAVLSTMARVGTAGALVILAVFAVGFLADVAAWQLTFAGGLSSIAWFGRLWQVNMVGEALNILAPLGALGGEPIKALLLKRQYGVPYTDGAASLLLIQTINSLAQVPFITIGVILMLLNLVLPPTIQQAILWGSVVIVAFMGLLLAALHTRVLSHILRRRGESLWAERFSRAIAATYEVEEQLFLFVRHQPGRFLGSLLLSFVNWSFGALEIYLILLFLGAKMSFADSWLLETAVVVIRSFTFFVPGSIGAQDGVIAVVGATLAGSTELGLAAALVRRTRELVWSGIGLGVGGLYGLQSKSGT